MAVKRSRAAFLCVRRCFSVESKLGRTPYSELQLINNFVSADEERDIIQNLSTVFKRKRYVGSHFDSVITNYRETELVDPNSLSLKPLIDKMQFTIREHYGESLQFMTPHVIDLKPDGFISAHVDSIKFSGGIISVVNLLSPRILRVSKVRNDNSNEDLSGHLPEVMDVFLPPRSAYIISNALRYDYTHEILGTRFTRPWSPDLSVESGSMKDALHDRIQIHMYMKNVNSMTPLKCGHNDEVVENSLSPTSVNTACITYSKLTADSESYFKVPPLDRRVSVMLRDVLASHY